MAQDHEQQLNNNKLLMEILSRLPVKSLLRFRSVSKPWKSVISSNSLRKLHCQRHKSPLPLLLTFHSSQDRKKSSDPNALYDYSLIIFDLFGKVVQQWTLPIKFNYLCMLSFNSQSKLVCFTDAKSRYFPYNPTTRKLFTLPDPPSLLFPSSYKKYAMPGFGYNPSKDEYIFIELFDRNQQGNWVCEIITMSLDSNDNNNYDQLHYNEWRSTEVVLPSSKLVAVQSSGQFACGAFYWDACQENETGRHSCFLSFDVETQVFSTFEWPQGVIPTFLSELLELKGELYLENVNESPPSLDLWKLCYDDYNNKFWSHCWNINLQSLGYEDDDCPDPDEFDYAAFIQRFEYLKHYYNEPLSFNMLRKLGKLKLEDQDIEDEEEDEDDYPSMLGLCPLIHTNIFIL